MPQPVVLVDVMNLVFRAHYTFKNLSADGKPTGVLYGSLRALHDLRTKVSPRIVFCWDHGIPVPGASRPANWRAAILPTYKANRVRNSDYPIVVSQLPALGRILGVLGYTNLGVPGLEADDVIGVLSHQFVSKGEKVLILSSDKDLYQLLTEQARGWVRILVPQQNKSAFRVINAAEVEKKFEVPIARWAEYLALGGDSADNIKPRRGMGPKTAVRLLNAGLCLHKAVAAQPQAVVQKHDLASIWEQIQASYSAARIPLTWSDPRIKTRVPVPPVITANQVWKNEAAKQAAMKEFAAFCADNEMITLFSLRRSFFNLNEGITSCPPPTPIQRPLQKKNQISLRSILD